MWIILEGRTGDGGRIGGYFQNPATSLARIFTLLFTTDNETWKVLLSLLNRTFRVTFWRNSIFFLLFSFPLRWIFRAVLGSWQNWAQSTEMCHVPLPHTHSRRHYQCPPPEWDSWYNWWTYIDTSSLPKVQSLHYVSFTLGIVHSMGFDNCVIFDMYSQL